MKNISALVAGLIFGMGLLLAGMANPAKVLGFLDLAGAWDPSLMFVMIGAVTVSAVGFGFARARTKSLLGDALQFPTATRIDRRLILGSVMFGIGWGIAGICPGPAVVLLGAGISKGIVFFIAMLAGMAGFAWIERRAPALQTE